MMKLLLSVCVCVCVLTGSCASPVSCTNPFIDDVATVSVLSVQDGDTFRIRVERDSVGVRVLGVDVFESRRGDRLTGQAQRAGITVERALVRGQAARDFARRTITGAVEIRREAATENIDVFGRLLRRAYINGVEYVLMIPDSLKVP